MTRISEWRWNKGRPPTKFSKTIDTSLPEWRAGVREREWLTTAVECGKWRRENGRVPAVEVSDPVERRFGTWLARQRPALMAVGNLSAAAANRADILDQLVVGWRTGSNTDWITTAVDCSNWTVANNGVFPKPTAIDPTERRFGRWFNAQRSLVLAGNPGRDYGQRERLMDLLLPGWRKDPE